MTKTKQEKSAGAIIYYIEKDKPKFLLLKYTTYWGFAKGIIESGESIEETIRREIKEETGLKDIEIIPGFQFKQNWFYKTEDNLVRKEAFFLLAKVSKEEAEKVKISHEHEDFDWLTYEEALKTMKIKQNREMLKAAYKFIKEYEKQRKLV